MTDIKNDASAVFLEPNPKQRAVINAAVDAWLLVVAGPGTGKTQVAAMRLLRLLEEGLQPAQILVLSFSRSAVATLTQRIAALGLSDELLIEDIRHLGIRTFDSWAFRMLRQNGMPVAELLSHGHDENIRRVTEALLGDGNPILDRLSGIRHVIVDEFQDLPGVRAEMVTALLSRLNRNGSRRVGFTVLGDPVQAIYRFAARNGDGSALSDPWADLKRRIGAGLQEITLEQNHRATPELAKMAEGLRRILSNGVQDPIKKLAAMKRFLGCLPTSLEQGKLDENWLAGLPKGSIAVLTRTNGEAVQVWKMLMGKSVEPPMIPISLRIVGSVSPAPAWVAALLWRFKPSAISRSVFETAYRTVSSQIGEQACARIHLPPVDVAWIRLARASGANESVSSIELEDLRARLEWPDSFPDDEVMDVSAIHITTVHQAKGMEFESVHLLDERDRGDEAESIDPLEEANVGFVAVTRAGRTLGRLPGESIHRPPSTRKFAGGRVRQMGWGKLVNFQIGLQGDLEPSSFVDSAVLGDDAAVISLQQSLLDHGADWQGRKVVLRKTIDVVSAKDVRYDVHLQNEDDGDGSLVGRTAAQVTWDLLDALWKAGYAIPKVIYNLRISAITSVSDTGELPMTVPEPWRSSRIWLGVILMGTGDFKTWKRSK